MKSKTLEDYYLDHFNNVPKPYKCEQCDNGIYKLNSSNIAHILPKSKFPSVSLEYYNYLLLCGSCHATFDSSFKKASTMKCFIKAMHRYNLFKDYVEEDHKILEYFNQ